MKVPAGTVKGVLAFAALAAATLASSEVLGERAYRILFLEALLFVIYLALHTREGMKASVGAWSRKIKEDVLIDAPASQSAGGEDDVFDKSRPAGTEDGRLLATKGFLLFDAEGGTRTSIRREKIEFVRKGILMEDGIRAHEGFSGVLLVTAGGKTHKFLVGDIDRWMRMLKYPTD